MQEYYCTITVTLHSAVGVEDECAHVERAQFSEQLKISQAIVKSLSCPEHYGLVI
jgi:hypothetical protein